MTMVEAVGWTVLHSLWQGGVVALLCAAGDRAMAQRGPAARHAIAWSGLAALVSACLVTFALRVGGVTTGGGGTGAAGVSAAAAGAVGVPWIELAGLVWMAGAVVGLAWRVGGLVVLHRVRNSTAPASAAISAAAARLAGALGMARPVDVRVSARIQVPVQIGWWRPLVVLPAAALSGLPASQVEALLAHELAHIRRHDYLANLLQAAIETGLFYHPAVWWLSGRIRTEREHCCDDLAVAVSADRVTYARALVSLETLRTGPSLALAATGGSLVARVRRLLASSPTLPVRAGRSSAWLATAALLATGLAVVSARTPGTSIDPSGTQAAAPSRPADEAASGDWYAPVVERIEFLDGIPDEARAQILARADLRVGSRFTAAARHRLGRSLSALGLGMTFTDRPGRGPMRTRVVISPDC